MKYNSKRILVGIEDSESSTHALEYVADLARGDGGFVIHAIGSVSPFLWSCVSSVGLRIQELKDNWIHSCNKNVIIGSERQNRGSFTSRECQAAIDRDRHFGECHHNLIVLQDRQDFIGEILKTASRNHCGTIVVGQSHLP